MILGAAKIRSGVRDGAIVIDPFDERFLNPNSYDLHLAGRIACLSTGVIDPLRETHFEERAFERSFTTQPGELYLAHTIERAGSTTYVPKIEGKSTLARLGLSVHITAGYGDVGFVGCWTLEITTVRPFVLHAGMPICQIEFTQLLCDEEAPLQYKGDYNHRNGIGYPKPRKDWILLR